MKIAIIGLGLIGGSLAIEFQKNHTVYGIDSNAENQQKAVKLGLVEKIIDYSKLPKMDVVVIAVPVNATPKVAVEVLEIINDKTLVFDVGSTKEGVCNAVKKHPKRANFVAVHPIAGTEFSGPNAAIENLFTNKVSIICEQELSAKKQIDKLLHLFEPINMRMVFMNSAKKHDKHIAYVSHLSHISSFMLGKTVLEIEKGEKNIFDMAGSGFASTVRLAKSSPNTWTPIFMQNKKYILKSLDEYINNLLEFKKHLQNESKEAIYQTMEETNHIKEVLNGIIK